MLWIRTWDRDMVGADESTELWCPQNSSSSFPRLSTPIERNKCCISAHG